MDDSKLKQVAVRLDLHVQFKKVCLAAEEVLTAKMQFLTERRAQLPSWVLKAVSSFDIDACLFLIPKTLQIRGTLEMPLHSQELCAYDLETTLHHKRLP